MMMFPILAFGVSSVATHFKYSSQAFDDLTDEMPSIEAERDRMQVINLCLLGDYVMNTKAMLAEVEYCKAPSDYIYSTLV